MFSVARESRSYPRVRWPSRFPVAMSSGHLHLRANSGEATKGEYAERGSGRSTFRSAARVTPAGVVAHLDRWADKCTRSVGRAGLDRTLVSMKAKAGFIALLIDLVAIRYGAAAPPAHFQRDIEALAIG